MPDHLVILGGLGWNQAADWSSRQQSFPVRQVADEGYLRERNERYLFERFGDAEEFGILMRVRVLRGRTITPNLHDSDVPLYEWPERMWVAAV